MKEVLQKCRIDKWLWAVRLFKTRTAASDAVSSGKVKVDATAVKSSYLITKNKIISIRKNGIIFQFKVQEIIENRVGAELAIACYENITSEEELFKLSLQKAFSTNSRDKGSGRPTKKNRRSLDDWMEIESHD